MEKVVIIGTGCAGLTAALYTARANLKPLVLTGSMPGGLLTTTSIVENFPGFPEGIDGYELMVRMQKQAERFGARVQFGTVEAVDFSRRPFLLTVDGEPIEAETVIISSGAGHRHRRGAPGFAPALEDSQPVEGRQTEVKHDRVVGLGVASEPGFLAVVLLVYGKAGKRQGRLDVAGEPLVVLR